MLDQFEKVWDMLVGTWPGVLFCICTMWYLYITLHDLHPGAYVYNWRIFLIWFVVLLSNSQMTLQPAADLSYHFCVSLWESATEISLWNTCPSLTEEYLTLQMEICILLINVYFFLERPALLFPVYDSKYKTHKFCCKQLPLKKIWIMMTNPVEPNIFLINKVGEL